MENLFIIRNKSGERMYQWPTFTDATLAQQVAIRQNEIRPNAGFHVCRLEGGEA